MDALINLQVSDVASCVCRVYDYQRQHSTLWIQIESLPEKQFHYLIFKGVFYFSGEFIWQGAEFQIKSHDATSQFINNLALAIPEPAVNTLYKLYRVEMNTPPIAIVAQAYYISLDADVY